MILGPVGEAVENHFGSSTGQSLGHAKANPRIRSRDHRPLARQRHDRLPMLHLRKHDMQVRRGEAQWAKEKNAGARPALSL
jgi:hypothetical protein